VECCPGIREGTGGGGKKLPLSPNLREVATRRMKTRKRGRFLPVPTLCPLKSSLCSVTSSTSKRGSLLAHASQSGPGLGQGHHLARCHSLVLH
jgi:hypothetical protein